jgi:hypothetical protein
MGKTTMLIPYTHDDLIARGVKWLVGQRGKSYYSPIIVHELVCYLPEIPDILGMNSDYTTLIECKTSLADFKKDAHKPFRNSSGLGTYRFYLCPVGQIPLSLIPDDWGLLYCHANKITVEKDAPAHDKLKTRYEEYSVLYSLVRRAILRGFDPYCRYDNRVERLTEVK